MTSDHLASLSGAATAVAAGSTGSIEVVNVDDDVRKRSTFGRSLWCCCAGGTSKRNCRLSCVSTMEEYSGSRGDGGGSAGGGSRNGSHHNRKCFPPIPESSFEFLNMETLLHAVSNTRNIPKCFRVQALCSDSLYWIQPL